MEDESDEEKETLDISNLDSKLSDMNAKVGEVKESDDDGAVATVAEGESVPQIVEGKEGNEDNSADSENLSDTTDGVSKEKDEGKTSSGEEKEGKAVEETSDSVGNTGGEKEGNAPVENVDPIEDKEKVVELEKAGDAEQAETKNENDENSSDVNSASVEVEKQNDSTSENNLEETSHTGQGEEKSNKKINSGNEEPIEQGQKSNIEDEKDTLDSKNNENDENATSNDDIDNSDSIKEENVNEQAVVSDVNQDDKENTRDAEHENAAKLETNVGHADGIENGMGSNNMQKKSANDASSSEQDENHPEQSSTSRTLADNLLLEIPPPPPSTPPRYPEQELPQLNRSQKLHILKMKLLPVGTPVKDFSSLEISSPPQLERDEKGRIFARLPPPPANLSLNDVQSKLNAMQNDFKIMKEGRSRSLRGNRNKRGNKRYGNRNINKRKKKVDNEKLKQENGGTPSAKVPAPLSPEQEIAEIKRVRAQGQGVQKLNSSWGINNSKERKNFSQSRKKSHSQSASSISGKQHDKRSINQRKVFGPKNSVKQRWKV